MVGPVDFHKDMDFWSQDKWSGSFPVRWHIIKNIPNAALKQVLLQNNEDLPVTSSRDTQEACSLSYLTSPVCFTWNTAFTKHDYYSLYMFVGLAYISLLACDFSTNP